MKPLPKTWLRLLLVGLALADAYEAGAYLFGSVLFFGIGFAAWRTPVEADLSKASGLASRNLHEFGMFFGFGLGIVLLFAGIFHAVAFILELRDLRRGRLF